MQLDNILIDTAEGITTLTINRPEVRNAMNQETWLELATAVRHAEQDSQTKVIVITGAGDQAFVAGADIKWLSQRPALDVLEYGGQDVLWEVENCTKPVIAAVNGYALGGGCELAMACDIRIAAENAQFGQPEANLGILPGAGGTQRLARLVGLGKAKELIFTGEIIDAFEAEKIGLVNKVVPLAELMDTVKAMAKKIMKKGPVAIRLAKTAINLSASTDLATGLLYEKTAQALLFTTDDRIEGTNAFLEKRKPEFQAK